MNKPPIMQVNSGIMTYDMKMQPQYDFTNFQSTMYDTRTVAPWEHLHSLMAIT